MTEGGKGYEGEEGSSGAPEAKGIFQAVAKSRRQNQQGDLGSVPLQTPGEIIKKEEEERLCCFQLGLTLLSVCAPFSVE